MSRWNCSTPQQRIQQWAELRQRLSEHSLCKQVQLLCEHMADWPLGARTVDYHCAAQWPSPWEILHHALYCRDSASILMYDTLKIINSHTPVELHLMEDHSDRYLVPVVNDCTLLNVVLGKAVSWQVHTDIVSIQRIADLEHRKLT